MIRRPPRSTRTDTLFPTRRSSDLNGLLEPVGQRLRRILVERLIAMDDDLVGARLARNLGLGFARYAGNDARAERSEEHTSELQSLMRISYAVFCLKKNITHNTNTHFSYNTQIITFISPLSP